MLWKFNTNPVSSKSPALAIAGVALILTVVAGCGYDKPAWEQVVPATGSVKYRGAPIDGALLVFTPKDKSVPSKVRPIATTDAGGHFDIGTFDIDDGIPEGDYDVTVTWSPLVKHDGGASPGPNLLPVRYARPETSQLTVHIDSEETELKPLELTP